MVRCSKHGSHSDTYKRIARRSGKPYESCRPCAKERTARWKAEHPEQYALYRSKHHDEYAMADRRSRMKLRSQIIKAYGSKCACCGTDRHEFLTVDHINGGGNAHRKALSGVTNRHPGGTAFLRWLRKNGFPKEGFRLLCMNCNWSFGKWGYCPHSTDPESYLSNLSDEHTAPSS